jgi:hypothetical protein
MSKDLSGSHRTTYDAIFQHPVARNLKWAEVQSLLAAIADSVQEHGDVLKVARNGQSLAIHRPARGVMDDAEELMKVRHFLERSETAAPQPPAGGLHLLVVIDHRLASVYRTELQGSVPHRVAPYDPLGENRHLHYVETDGTGRRRPELKSFYEAVARTLQGAEKILVFGSGTGASSAMEQLLADLKKHHADLARRVVGSVVINQGHMTENQLLAEARAFYANTAS